MWSRRTEKRQAEDRAPAPGQNKKGNTLQKWQYNIRRKTQTGGEIHWTNGNTYQHQDTHRKRNTLQKWQIRISTKTHTGSEIHCRNGKYVSAPRHTQEAKYTEEMANTYQHQDINRKRNTAEMAIQSTSGEETSALPCPAPLMNC